MKARRLCELCNGEATLFCGSDSAFLCWTCDARVHEANFLVARHVRRTLCLKCEGFDGKAVSGVGFRPVRRPICRSCASDDDLDGYESSTTASCSSTCISTAESVTGVSGERDRRRRTKEKVFGGGACSSCSASEVSIGAECSSSPACAYAGKPKKRSDQQARPLHHRISIDAKAEEVLNNWCRKLGLQDRRCVAIATRALSASLREVRIASLPSKILIASSLWMAWKASERRSSLPSLSVAVSEES
ncbi:hypothetical protein Syun_024816 [Stephania yunnanensis]|uniref:B box-type domain-containing protein n=1 Tax=Stephania yunnanensis TaxID=152371 RepID=A0AAP0HV65_9MAGN